MKYEIKKFIFKNLDIYSLAKTTSKQKFKMVSCWF